jgi:hypothetical protein
VSGKAFLTGVLAAGVLAAGALVTTSPATVVAGRAVAGDAPAPSPLGDSLSTGRGPDLAGLRAGASPPTAPSTPVVPPPAPPPQTREPGTVRLPEGGTAKLVRQEVGADGVLPVPEGIGEATWWGAEPAAQSGAMVLAGHVNWKGMTGPFEELWRTRTGGDVSLVDSAGKEIKYRISEVLTIHKDELPTRAVELFGPRGPHRLVLVTCGGEWVGGQVGYDQNRVVIAQPVN